MWKSIKICEYLKTGPFTLENDIQVESTRPPLKGQQLLIYRYQERKPIVSNTMKLRLPVVGKTIDVQLRKLNKEEVAEILLLNRFPWRESR